MITHVDIFPSFWPRIPITRGRSGIPGFRCATMRCHGDNAGSSDPPCLFSLPAAECLHLLPIGEHLSNVLQALLYLNYPRCRGVFAAHLLIRGPHTRSTIVDVTTSFQSRCTHVPLMTLFCACMLCPVHTAQYLRLMVIWTITTAFSGVYQSLAWLEHSSGSETENNLVKALLVLSVGGVIGNVRQPFDLVLLSAAGWMLKHVYDICPAGCVDVDRR